MTGRSITCGNPIHRGIREYAAGPDAHWRSVQVHHLSTDEVRRCFATEGGIPSDLDEELQREAEAEAATEGAQERWYEEAGSRGDPGGYEYDRRMEAIAEQMTLEDQR